MHFATTGSNRGADRYGPPSEAEPRPFQVRAGGIVTNALADGFQQRQPGGPCTASDKATQRP